MNNMEHVQTKAAPEVMLPRDQEAEAHDLMEAVMGNMDRRERERMADFLRGVRFAQTLGAAGISGA